VRQEIASEFEDKNIKQL